MTQDPKAQEGAEPVATTDTAWLDGILLDEEQADNADETAEDAASTWADPLALDNSEKSAQQRQGWLQKTFGVSPKPDKEVSDLKLKIRELQAQLQILAARPSVYEMDDSELLAVAGEDAAVLVRAAKAKAQSMLQDAEARVNRMKDDALQQLSAAKREAEKLIEAGDEEAKNLVEEAKSRAAKTLAIADEDARMTQLAAERERARVISEAESRLSEAKVEIERMRNEAQQRNLELMTRARNEAQAEAQSLLNDAYDERKTVIARLQGQNERVRQLADESARIRRHLTDLYKDVQLRLNEVITSINEIDERAGSLAEKADAATKNV